MKILPLFRTCDKCHVERPSFYGATSIDSDSFELMSECFAPLLFQPDWWRLQPTPPQIEYQSRFSGSKCGFNVQWITVEFTSVASDEIFLYY